MPLFISVWYVFKHLSFLDFLNEGIMVVGYWSIFQFSQSEARTTSWTDIIFFGIPAEIFLRDETDVMRKAA